MKNVRLIHQSLNFKRKQHIFNIFNNKKDEVNSPFELKEDKSSSKKPQVKEDPIKIAQSTLKQFEQQQQNHSNSFEGGKGQIVDEKQNEADQSQEKSKILSKQLIEEEKNKDPNIIQGSVTKDYQKRKIKKSILPPFQQLDDGLIHHFTMYSKNLQLHSPFRWTPFIQQDNSLVEERSFQLKMKEFRKKRYFEEKDEAELIDTFLFQALKNTGFDYYYDYECSPSKECPFHGRIDFLIYNRDSESKVPLVPILRARKEKNSLGEWIDKFNQAELVGAALWALTNMKAKDPSISICRAIHTNGNQWRMIQIDDKGGFEKTHIYTADNDEYSRIYKDLTAQSVAVGIIKFSLNQPLPQEVALKKVYDFVDERKYLTELDEETKGKLDRIQKHYFFLPKFLREFFFGYK